MARYRMTAARQRALRKAQLISARKRKRMFGFGGVKKLSKGHKRAIGTVVTGAALAGGAWGAYNVYTRFKRSKVLPVKPGDGEVRPQRMAGSSAVEWFDDSGGGSPASRIVTPSVGVKNAGVIRIRNSASQIVKDALEELRGTPVKGGFSPKRTVPRKYKIQYGDYVQTGVTVDEDGIESPVWKWVATSKATY